MTLQEAIDSHLDKYQCIADHATKQIHSDSGFEGIYKILSTNQYTAEVHFLDQDGEKTIMPTLIVRF